MSVLDSIETIHQLQRSSLGSVRSPLSVAPSHGRSNSSNPLHPFASQDVTTSSEVRTAIRGEIDWTIDKGGEGITALCFYTPFTLFPLLRWLEGKEWVALGDLWNRCSLLLPAGYHSLSADRDR